jgi:hypothetical protein
MPKPAAAHITALLAGLAASAPGRAAADGAYGRLDGDLSVSIEAGISEALGEEPHAGEALATRAGLIYVQTVGLAVQYDEGLGVQALPMRRSVAGLVELRPLFWGRFSENLEQGPAFLDLFLDSFGIAVGMFGAWPQARFCGSAPPDPGAAPAPGPDGGCPDYGMQAGVGFELPLIGRASAPFIGLRGAMRWSLRDRSAAFEAPPVSGLLTLTLGYRHLFETHLVDAADRLPP